MSRQPDSRRRDEGEHKEELVEKVLHVNRCAKVITGGRKFSFSAMILVGDGKGRVGFGFAKANELADSIKKGGELARKNMVTFEMDENGRTIPHEVIVSYDGVKLLLRPAAIGKGIIAGSKVRAVLEAAGIKDVVAKSLGSSNPFNQVKATFKALSLLRSRQKTLLARGISS